MSGYSDNSAMVRVDFFRETGKWYTTEAVEWIGYDGDIFQEFKDSLHFHFKQTGRLKGMWAICLEPYNKNSFPLMVKVP